MPLSASDTKNVRLGVCSVSFNGEDLGYTKGGVEVEVTTNTKKVTVDQFGETEINEYITGRMIKARVPLAESTLDRIQQLVPGSVLVTDGVDPTSQRLDVKVDAGLSLFDHAYQLVLHPTANLPANKTEDVTIFKAVTPGSFQFAFKVDEERVYQAEFVGYPDASNDNKLFAIGDLDATA